MPKDDERWLTQSQGAQDMQMVTFLAIHFIVGALLGTRFRIGIMLPVSAIVVVEGLVGAQWLDFAPWYALIILGVIAVQAGYGAAAVLKPASRSERETGRTPPIHHISAQE